MNSNKTLAAGLAGTTFMTLFSEAVSRIEGSNYNEAEVLGELFNRITPLNKAEARVAGYTGHYIVGLGFAVVYSAYLNKFKTKPSILNGIVYGALSGIAGAAVWHAAFKAHPNPLGVKLGNYYQQLVLAHIIFGVSAALVLQTKKQII